MSVSAPTPKVGGILETSLYVDDLGLAGRFYDEIFKFKRMVADERLIAYDVAGRSVLLLFRRGAAADEQRLPVGLIPRHDGAGPIHVAFSTEETALPVWERRLVKRGVAIEGRVDWNGGGASIYFRDPDGHLLELATRGIWPIY